MQGYAGVLLDNVQAICARVDANGLSDAKPEGPVFGGGRPINGSAKCPGDSTVQSAFISQNITDPYVGGIALRCRGELEPVRLRGTGRFATNLIRVNARLFMQAPNAAHHAPPHISAGR